MIKRLQICESSGFDPHYNIALEKYLLETVPEGTCILYLWQNKNTVVIGRNQNAWVECRTGLLEQEGGKLARWLSGGGAVFHDLGNLNFTFLMHQEDYDLDRQFDVILTACRSLGIRAEKSGRNDLLAEGYKFSGNAFYHSQGRAYHHGTLLIDADMDRLTRYLTPTKAKLEAKGVSSVRSRVTNLKQLRSDLTCDMMKRHVEQAFSLVYGLEAVHTILTQEAIDKIARDAQWLGSWDWCYGPRLPFSFACEDRFIWGGIQLQMQVESGHVQRADVYSDAMDWSLAQTVSASLTGCRFTSEDMCRALSAQLDNTDICSDICSMLTKQQL